MVRRMINRTMTSRVRSSYSELITHCHSTFRIDKIAWNYRKNSKYNRKKLQFITLLTAIVHCFERRRQQK